MAKKKAEIFHFGKNPMDDKFVIEDVDDDCEDNIDDDDWYDEDEPVCPGVSIHVNLNINISSVDELEKVEPIIDRLADKYGYNWE